MNREKESDNFTVYSSKQLVHIETKIDISFERLKILLSRIYETAILDASRFKPYKYYNVFLSVGLTLLLTLFTAQFNNFSFVSGQTIKTYIVWICIGCIVIGFVLALINVIHKNKNMLEDRDIAVDKALTDVTNESVVKKKEH